MGRSSIGWRRSATSNTVSDDNCSSLGGLVGAPGGVELLLVYAHDQIEGIADQYGYPAGFLSAISSSSPDVQP